MLNLARRRNLVFSYETVVQLLNVEKNWEVKSAPAYLEQFK